MIEYPGTGTLTFVCVSLLFCAVSFGLTWRDYRNGWKISQSRNVWLFILIGISTLTAIYGYNSNAGKLQVTKPGVLIAKCRSIYHHRNADRTYG